MEILPEFVLFLFYTDCRITEKLNDKIKKIAQEKSSYKSNGKILIRNIDQFNTHTFYKLKYNKN